MLRRLRALVLAVVALLAVTIVGTAAWASPEALGSDEHDSHLAYGYDPSPALYDEVPNLAAATTANEGRSGVIKQRVADGPGPSLASSGDLLAPEAAGGVRYAANSVGEVVPYVRGGTLEVPSYAVRRMTERGIDIGLVDDLVSRAQGFRYYHGGAWKTGYYDSSAQLFVGTAGDRITTVIQGSRVNQNYINNLRAARP